VSVCARARLYERARLCTACQTGRSLYSSDVCMYLKIIRKDVKGRGEPKLIKKTEF
jgi:hypothetical protein